MSTHLQTWDPHKEVASPPLLPICSFFYFKSSLSPALPAQSQEAEKNRTKIGEEERNGDGEPEWRAEQASGNGPQKPASERRPLRSNPPSPLPPHQHLAYRSPLSFFLTLMLQYMLETSLCPREPECTKELRQITAKHPWCVYVPALRPTSGIKSVIEDRNRSLMI